MCQRGFAINRSHKDVEFWGESLQNIESQTFIVAWGEFFPTLEDVVALTGLPIFGEPRIINMPGEVLEVALDEAGKRKLEALN